MDPCGGAREIGKETSKDESGHRDRCWRIFGLVATPQPMLRVFLERSGNAQVFG